MPLPSSSLSAGISTVTAKDNIISSGSQTHCEVNITFQLKIGLFKIKIKIFFVCSQHPHIFIIISLLICESHSHACKLLGIKCILLLVLLWLRELLVWVFMVVDVLKSFITATNWTTTNFMAYCTNYTLHCNLYGLFAPHYTSFENKCDRSESSELQIFTSFAFRVIECKTSKESFPLMIEALNDNNK